MALGYPHTELRIKVYKRNGYLEIDGKRLDEYQPGVFFTKKGDCLDFTGPTPLWKGQRMSPLWRGSRIMSPLWRGVEKVGVIDDY